MTTEESEQGQLPNLQAPSKPNTLWRIFGWVKQKFLSLFSLNLRAKISQLTVSQYFYFAAFIVFIMKVDDNYFELDEFVTVGVIAGIGLLRELWQLFLRVWDKMLGKGVLLVLYAGIANFVLAVSAQKINAIVGIEPSVFVFTLGFTTLLMLPFWLISSTVVFFSIAMVALNLWLLISIMVRLVRIKIKVHWEDTSFIFLTMILRLILVPSVIFTLVFFATPYVNQIGLFGQISEGPEIEVVNLDDEDLQQADLLEAPVEEEAGTEVDSEVGTDSELGTDLEVDTDSRVDSEIETDSESSKKIRYLDIMIANFVFWFETYPNSACIKEQQQRSLIIDENSMLIVEKDDSELGYAFTVKPCIPVYQKPPEIAAMEEESVGSSAAN